MRLPGHCHELPEFRRIASVSRRIRAGQPQCDHHKIEALGWQGHSPGKPPAVLTFQAQNGARNAAPAAARTAPGGTEREMVPRPVRTPARAVSGSAVRGVGPGYGMHRSLLSGLSRYTSWHTRQASVTTLLTSMTSSWFSESAAL